MEAGGNSGVGYLIVLTSVAAETAKVLAAIFAITLIGTPAHCVVILIDNCDLHYKLSRENSGF
mgnify:FL=1|tara:strand:+ start:41 stop:229 length:189 start_codon:yes stop_codon:yes gene_type:complete